MAAQVTISQLPTAGPLTGTELVPVVQNGGTVKTTVADIAASPNNTQSFLTAVQEPTLANSRYLQGNNGVTLSDGGAQNPMTVELTGAALAFLNASAGLIAKTSTSTVASRILLGSGSGLSVTNGNGVSGNPTIALAGRNAALESLSGTSGLVALSGTGLTSVDILGTSNQISVANGSGPGNPTIAIASNPVLPGAAGVVVPSGTTAQRPAVPTPGTIRYNTDLGNLEAYDTGSGWSNLPSGAVSLINTGVGLLGGPITTTGTIDIDTTVVATATNTMTLTNKSMSGAFNTFSNIPNSSLSNSSVTIGSTTLVLGATSLSLAGLTSVTLTQDPVSNLQAATKQYVDNLVATGLYYHPPVQVATTQSLAAQTGGTVTYNNGTSGVGATLTLSVALTTLDGYSLVNGDRILVKNEVNQAYNGVYVWATGGTVLTRSTDTDSYGTGTGDLSENDYFFVQNGTVNKGSSYVCTTSGTIVFGTTAIVFSQFSTSQVYTSGTGLTLTGTQFSITNTGVTAASYGSSSSVATFTVNSQGQLTLAASASIAIAASQITSGTIDTARISGSYTGITGVGTLSTGTWSANTIGAGYGGTGQSVYGVGDILYASGTSALSKLNLGTAGYVMTAGASAPQYVAQSTLSVGSATTATTATNIAGGLANQIHYQTGPGATSFITAPSVASTYLQWTGSAFTWAAAGTGTVTSVNVSGGTTGLTFSGGPVTTSGTITMAGTLAIANGGTNATATPTAGAVSYGTGTAYAFTSAGTSGQVLTSAGAASPTWTSQSSLSVGTATNLAGGANGSIPYQTASGTTTFLAAGTNGYVLTLAGGVPTWAAASGGGITTGKAIAMSMIFGF